GAAVAEWSEQQAGGRHGLRVEVLDHADRLELDADLRATLFRNIRELTTNVIKHARAHNISIRLEQGAGELVITVRDDGVGCDPEIVLRGISADGGFGLFSIQERMTDLGGRLELVSQPGAGCSAILRLPLKGRSPEMHP
ncbi:MAG: histidine kinase, partial [Sulfitobacter sp.]|nr:histidine kinase [Sulfitobacter sp.]